MDDTFRFSVEITVPPQIDCEAAAMYLKQVIEDSVLKLIAVGKIVVEEI